MNSSLQVLRAIPELQTALSNFKQTSSTSNGNSALTSALASMYSGLKSTVGAFTPMAFLSVLRQTFPQFGEMARSDKFYERFAASVAPSIFGAIGKVELHYCA